MEKDLAAVISKHRRWLDRMGLKDKPWLILGSAPDPTIPVGITSTHLRIDINNVGRTATALGLGRASLTIRARRKSWEEHQELDTQALLWIHEYPTPLLKALLALKPHKFVGSIGRISRRNRDALVAEIASTRLENIGELNKVTNGVAAVCYGLAIGVPRIVLAGISLSKNGHSYDQLERKRRQVDEDAYVLHRLSSHPALYTTEADLAMQTGLPLVRGPDTPTSGRNP